ncbi:MAG TPA: PLP-dependent aminotransferase family protein [Xanthobacteraceae bacterium]|nr:PLP-dependent aminotransferase family protein [Xanthobacteraceae bacterium]
MPLRPNANAPGTKASNTGSGPATPLVDQIVIAMQRDIDTRKLPPGARVPSIRDLARRQLISRHSAVEAYDRLVAAGYLESRPGSGFYVAARGRGTPDTGAGERRRIYDVAWLIRQALEDGSDMLKVGGPWLPDAWLDCDGIQRVVRALGREPGGHLLHYGHPLGYLPLRQQLQLKLAEIGITTTPDQIVLTCGTSQALELVTRYLLSSGDTAFVDDPGYYNLFGFLRQSGIRLVGVPRNVDGPDIAAMRQLLTQHRPKAFFTQTLMQNPTGTDMSPSVMHRVLQAAEEFDFTIIEDDTYCDIGTNPSARLATLDQLNRVIYVRSFSKTLSGSLRVGFAAASPPIADAITNLKVLSCITTSLFSEKLIHRLLIEGHYRKFLDRLRVRITQARSASMRLLASVGMAAFCEPAGGNFLWARFPHIEDSEALIADARGNGIMLAPGAVFRPNLESSPYLRFNVTMCGDPRLESFLRKAGGEGRTARGETRPVSLVTQTASDTPGANGNRHAP